MRLFNLILIELILIVGLINVISASWFGLSEEAELPQDGGKRQGKQIGDKN